jgi:hypothetical protein
MRKFLAACAILFFSLPQTTVAGLFVPTYTETVEVYNREIADVMEANSLSGQDATLALTTAAEWIYFLPCKGSTKDVPKADGFGAIGAVATASPKQPSGAALLEIIALFFRNGAGAGVNSDGCRFAKDTVIANTR